MEEFGDTGESEIACGESRRLLVDSTDPDQLTRVMPRVGADEMADRCINIFIEVRTKWREVGKGFPVEIFTKHVVQILNALRDKKIFW